MVVLRDQSGRCSSRGQFLYKSATGIFTFRIALVGNGQLFCRASGKAHCKFQWQGRGRVFEGLIQYVTCGVVCKTEYRRSTLTNKRIIWDKNYWLGAPSSLKYSQLIFKPHMRALCVQESMKQILITVLLFISLQSYATEIKVNPGKYSNYYHMKFELLSGQYELNAEYGFNKGGQFEVFVPKEHFPIAAPKCKENIIIRMPHSKSESKKRALFDSLSASKSVTVTLELNPYINVLKTSPLEIELQYCNVFFRHRAGDYFDQL